MIVRGIEFSPADLVTVAEEYARSLGWAELHKRAAAHDREASRLRAKSPGLAQIHADLLGTFERLADLARALDAERVTWELKAQERARAEATGSGS